MPWSTTLLASSTVWSTERWYCPGIEEISWRMPCPGTTNRGKINSLGARRVSCTRRRKAILSRSRRARYVGKGITRSPLVPLVSGEVVLQGFQNSASPTGTHLGCQALAELGWLLYGTAQLLAQELRAVG